MPFLRCRICLYIYICVLISVHAVYMCMCLCMHVKFSQDPRVLTRMTLPNYYILQAPPHTYGPLRTCTCHCCWAGDALYIYYVLYVDVFVYLHLFTCTYKYPYSILIYTLQNIYIHVACCYRGSLLRSRKPLDDFGGFLQPVLEKNTSFLTEKALKLLQK